MEKVADRFHVGPRWPQRAEPQSLPPGADHLLPSFHPRPPPPPPYPLSHPSPLGSAAHAQNSKVTTLPGFRNSGREARQSGLERRKPPGPLTPHGPTPHGPALPGLSSSSSDEDSAPSGSNLSAAEFDWTDRESLAGLDLGLLAFPRCSAEGSSLEDLSDAGSPAQPQATLQTFSRAARPDKPPRDKGPRIPDGPHLAAQGILERRPGGQGAWCWELEGQLRRSSLELPGPGGGLWRADSLDSLGSDGSSLSLSERVEMNRDIVKKMLNGGSKSSSAMEGTAAQWRDRGSIPLNDNDWDSGISLQDSEHCHRVFAGSDEPLSARHEQAKRLLERARMKARCFPLKADHNLLPVHTHQVSKRAVLGGEEGVAPPSGNQSDSSSGDSACAPPRRRPGHSPTRVRFEDETEKEAESRYLERLRQRRRAGERAQGLLVSKPHLSAYVNGRKEAEPHPAANGAPPEPGGIPERGFIRQTARRAQERLLTHELASKHPSPPPGLPEREGRVSAPYWVAPSRPCLTLRTERIKETYIGTIAPDNATPLAGGDISGGGGAERGDGRVSTMQVRRGTNQVELTGVNGHLGPFPPDIVQTKPTVTPPRPATGTQDLPPNPYASDQIAMPSQPQPQVATPPVEEGFNHSLASAPPNTSSPSSSCSPPPIRSALRSQVRGRLQVRGRAAVLSHTEPCAGGELRETGPTVRAGGQVLCPRSSREKFSSSPARNIAAQEPPHPPHPPQPTAMELSRDGPAYDAGADGRVREPMRAEQQRDSSPSPDQRTVIVADAREGRSKISLRRIFSAMRLSGAGRGPGRGRSSSLDQIRSRPAPDLASPDLASPGLRKPSAPAASSQLRKTPSLQSLSMGSPFLHLRKSSSVQSFHSVQKKSDRSAAYSPAPQELCRGMQRALSVEDVGSPSGVRSVGRVVQTFPDGTLLLELLRPPHGPYGFLISRGKGRPDTGVYVEDMLDSTTEKLYVGLLSVGDEILEVNGEKVSGLSLDLVTRLLTQDCSASVRLLPHKRPPPR